MHVLKERQKKSRQIKENQEKIMKIMKISPIFDIFSILSGHSILKGFVIRIDCCQTASLIVFPELDCTLS